MGNLRCFAEFSKGSTSSQLTLEKNRTGCKWLLVNLLSRVPGIEKTRIPRKLGDWSRSGKKKTHHPKQTQAKLIDAGCNQVGGGSGPTSVECDVGDVGVWRWRSVKRNVPMLSKLPRQSTRGRLPTAGRCLPFHGFTWLLSHPHNLRNLNEIFPMPMKSELTS